MPHRRQSAIAELSRRVIDITETLNCGKNPLDNKAAEQETQVFQKCKPSVSGRGAAAEEASCIWFLSFHGLWRYDVRSVSSHDTIPQHTEKIDQMG